MNSNRPGESSLIFVICFAIVAPFVAAIVGTRAVAVFGLPAGFFTGFPIFLVVYLAVGPASYRLLMRHWATPRPWVRHLLGREK